MKYLGLVLPLLAVGLASCDKAKQAVDAARDKIEGVKDPGLPKAPGGDVSANYAGQVDTAAEGVRFRRDLPFPPNLKVRVTERTTFHKARVITTSALGSETVVTDGTHELVGVIDRRGPQVSLTIEKLGRVVDPKEAVEKAKASAEGSRPASGDEASNVVGKRVEFLLGTNGWRPPESRGAVDFHLKVLQQDLLPGLPELLVDYGLAPRLQWFSSSRRWMEGDKLVLQGDALGLLFGDGTSGNVTLTYEVLEALEGHPCGRFAVQGNISVKNSGTLDGNSARGEITIQSGRVWCSLLHPLVMREEYKTVQTVTKGQGGGPKEKIQGAIDELKSLQWTP
jgi:hypothetical protein